MKLIKSLIPIVSLATIPATAATLSACSCSVTKVIDLADITIKEETMFGTTGNYNKGTTYNYRMNLSKWSQEAKKPKESEWSSIIEFEFLIQKTDKSEFKLTNMDNIKLTCDGSTLNKGTTEQYAQGLCDWCIDTEESNSKAVAIYIANKSGTPVKYNSTIIVEGIQYESDTSDILTGFVRSE